MFSPMRTQTSEDEGLAALHCVGLGSLAGLVPDVIDAYPEVTIVASKVALAYLKGLTNRSFTERAVKGGDKVSRGIYSRP